jgi:hypothetical protein
MLDDDQGLERLLPDDHRAALISGANFLVDECLQDIEDLADPEFPFADTRMMLHLPRQHLRHYTPLFARKFTVCVVTVAWKLTWPRPLPLACLAEELALSAIIDEATTFLELQGVVADFDDFIEEWFQDLDFEILFDPAKDGIDDSEQGRRLGIGSLHPRDWFEPFGGPAAVVHPYVAGDEAHRPALDEPA